MLAMEYGNGKCPCIEDLSIKSTLNQAPISYNDCRGFFIATFDYQRVDQFSYQRQDELHPSKPDTRRS